MLIEDLEVQISIGDGGPCLFGNVDVDVIDGTIDAIWPWVEGAASRRNAYDTPDDPIAKKIIAYVEKWAASDEGRGRIHDGEEDEITARDLASEAQYDRMREAI